MKQNVRPAEFVECLSLDQVTSASADVIVFNTFFDLASKNTPWPPARRRLADATVKLLEESARALKTGGLLFVYGLPRELPLVGEWLRQTDFTDARLTFKYWIALGVDERPAAEQLFSEHQGLLLFLKTAVSTKVTASLNLHTGETRAPHSFCAACGLNVKDWGGKKHLMNPNGTALSDVWRDLPKTKLRDYLIPPAVLARIAALTAGDDLQRLHVIQTSPAIEDERNVMAECKNHPPDVTSQNGMFKLDEVHQTDCVSFLSQLARKHPDGVFDLAFADPPYNLKKDYASYDDALAEQHYLDWCNAWLDGMIRTLKPGGSLFVLNLPQWAIHHAAFLSRHLEFRDWIVWDALGDPRGKLMPAHYALLYFTKPGGKPVFNYANDNDSVQPPDAPKYCLRASCIKKRKRLGDDDKIPLSDIWFDVHRIKHKRDRDAHPCQLPEKLMERIILLTTHRGGVVFDPFCGAGTTAVTAAKLGRHFVVTELDSKYAEITRRKLGVMKQNLDLFGEFYLPRVSAQKRRLPISKREAELRLQTLARELKREPTEQEIESRHPGLLEKIDAVYPTRTAAIKRCRIVLR